ncbi:MAG: transporter substrate-binding domain-containing protein, partial [Ruminococcus sp.]|nr:transporter substrate-binding domain-containing protein [Ruminococcus sp.]
SGKWIGFDADMAAAFAESLGVKAYFVEIDWYNMFLELDGGTIDCVWNGMTLTDEVTSAMSCSDPYCNNAQVVVVNKNVADKYAQADACKELNFAVESGSAGQEQATAYGFKFTEVKDQATALMEVASGACDAAIIDSLMAAAMVGEGTGYEQLTYTASLNSEEYGVGFRKGSDLTAKLNEFFAAAKADGSMEKVAETYKVQAALIK